MEDRRQRRRVLAIALAIIATAGLVVAAMTNRWLASPDHDAGMGLRSAELCDGSECTTISNYKVIDMIEDEITRTKAYNAKAPPREQIALPRKPWHGFPVVGDIAFFAALLAAAGLLGGMFLAVAGKRPELPIMPTSVAVIGLIIALICGCIFVATKPDENQQLGVGWSFWVFGGGIVLGLAAVFPLNRQIRPIDEELGAASATMSWGTSRDEH